MAEHWNLSRPWRVGRKVGRTIYAMRGDEPSDEDMLIGVMDFTEIAKRVVADHNAHLDRGDDA